MIPEFGLLCLILALIVACGQVGVQFYSSQASVMARSGATAQFLCVTLAFAALILSHAESDFTVLNVVQNSHTAQPMIYKIAGAWGNHEGSMLLWVWVLALFGFLYSWKPLRADPMLQARTIGVQSAICAGFLLFILLTSSPFARVFPPPMNGESLNPLLQDIGLALHPPMLYLGYVGNSMVFSLAVAALIQGKMGRDWATLAQPWILLSWSILTVGIGLGSWWAYRELGWGGWWFWDPVENASLMPWLASTALLHSNLVLEKRGTLRGWVLLLSIVTFSLSLLGTFLVRSGVLTSVHSFASDPTRGMFILLYIAVVTGGALWLFAMRLPKLLSQDQEQLTPISREGSIIANNLFLITACATIVLATLYPLFLELGAQQKVSIGPPYFEATFYPIMAPLVLLCAIGPLMAWKKASISELKRPLVILAGCALAAAVLVALFSPKHTLMAMAGLGLTAWLMTGIALSFVRRTGLFTLPMKEAFARARQLNLRYFGMAGAHLGVAVFVAGVTASSLWKVELEQTVKAGETISDVAGFDLTYKGDTPHRRGTYSATRGEFTVTRQGNDVTTLFPESRFYPVRSTRTSESAIYSTPLYDLYAVITPLVSGDEVSTRIYFNPLIAGVWGGFLLMAGGGILSIFGKGRRA